MSILHSHPQPPLELTIKSQKFYIPVRYRAGDVLSAADAQALDRLRVENIRNVMCREWNKATAHLADGQEDLTPEELELFRTRLHNYADNYQFPLKHRASKVADPVMCEARDLALRALARQGNHEPTESEVEATAIELIPDARQNLKAKANIALEALGL